MTLRTAWCQEYEVPGNMASSVWKQGTINDGTPPVFSFLPSLGPGLWNDAVAIQSESSHLIETSRNTTTDPSIGVSFRWF